MALLTWFTSTASRGKSFTRSSASAKPRAPSPPTKAESTSTCCRSRRVAPPTVSRARAMASRAVAASPCTSAISATPACATARPGSAWSASAIRSSPAGP